MTTRKRTVKAILARCEEIKRPVKNYLPTIIFTVYVYPNVNFPERFYFFTDILIRHENGI